MSCDFVNHKTWSRYELDTREGHGKSIIKWCYLIWYNFKFWGHFALVFTSYNHFLWFTGSCVKVMQRIYMYASIAKDTSNIQPGQWTPNQTLLGPLMYFKKEKRVANRKSKAYMYMYLYLFTLASSSYLQMTLDKTQCLGVLTGPKPLPMKNKGALFRTCTSTSG